MRPLISLFLALFATSALALPPTATLRWGAVTTYSDGEPITTPVTYSVYQGTQGGAKTRVATGLTTLSQVITAGLTPNSTMCWEITATAGGQESSRSNEACKTFPPQVPVAPTLTVQ